MPKNERNEWRSGNKYSRLSLPLLEKEGKDDKDFRTTSSEQRGAKPVGRA